MAQRYADPLTDHEYDGIREFDNPTPGWWHALFLSSVVFAIFYFVFWEFSPMAYSIQEAHAAVQQRELRRQFAEIGDLSPDQPTILRMMGEPKWMSVAAATFKGNCASCHGANAEGNIGPNMTDDYYKNIKVITDIPRVIAEGANNGAMPSWRNRLQPNEVVLLASYIASLRGKNLPGPRGAEGEVIPPWPVAPAKTEGTPPAAAPPKN